MISLLLSLKKLLMPIPLLQLCSFLLLFVKVIAGVSFVLNLIVIAIA